MVFAFFYGSITCMNTIAQLIIYCVLHCLQFATNIFSTPEALQKISHYFLDH